MERFTYFARRLLLVIPTFLGITFFCYLILQFVPGGPIEQEIAKMRGGAMGEGGGSTAGNTSGGITEDQRKALEKAFDLDKPFLHRYWIWPRRQEDGHGGHVLQIQQQDRVAAHLGAFPVSLTFGLTGFLPHLSDLYPTRDRQGATEQHDVRHPLVGSRFW